MPLCLQCQYQPHFPALTALEKNHSAFFLDLCIAFFGTRLLFLVDLQHSIPVPLVILLCHPVSALQGRICWLCCVSYSSKSNTYSADQQNKQHYEQLANARCNYLPVIIVKGFFAWQQCWWSCASIIGLQAVSFHMLNLKRWACASKWWFHMNCIYT